MPAAHVEAVRTLMQVRTEFRSALNIAFTTRKLTSMSAPLRTKILAELKKDIPVLTFLAKGAPAVPVVPPTVITTTMTTASVPFNKEQLKQSHLDNGTPRNPVGNHIRSFQNDTCFRGRDGIGRHGRDDRGQNGFRGRGPSRGGRGGRGRVLSWGDRY